MEVSTFAYSNLHNTSSNYIIREASPEYKSGQGCQEWRWRPQSSSTHTSETRRWKRRIVSHICFIGAYTPSHSIMLSTQSQLTKTLELLTIAKLELHVNTQLPQELRFRFSKLLLMFKSLDCLHVWDTIEFLELLLLCRPVSWWRWQDHKHSWQHS